MKAFLTTADVAAELGLPDAAALHRRRRLLEAQGFPRPLPYSRRPLRWHAASVRAWLQAAACLAADGEDLRPGFSPANEAAYARATVVRAITTTGA